MANKRNNPYRKIILVFGIVANLSLLGYFKYADFFIENINLLTGKEYKLLHLALPLAISFFTFQQITYLVDSYRGETKGYNFLNYALFVTFFPQLIAGPIVHHKEMMPQFSDANNREKNYENIAKGLFIFSIGLFKKVIIADNLSSCVNAGFDTAEVLNFFEAWITSLSYTFQLYYDFSGYTDMAIGAALLFNIKLPTNFNSPYKATSIQDFWRRWHITLSRFLRDYIYIPLGGNRKGEYRTYTNLLTTFILGGLWHGAGWTFIFWGFLHGIALVLHRIWKEFGFSMHKILAWFITFNFINISWVFFRAKEWDDALNVLHGMLGLDGVMLPNQLVHQLGFLHRYGIEFGRFLADIQGSPDTIIWLVIAFIFGFTFKNSIEQLYNFRLSYRTVIQSGTAFICGVLALNQVHEFLYFNF